MHYASGIGISSAKLTLIEVKRRVTRSKAEIWLTRATTTANEITYIDHLHLLTYSPRKEVGANTT